MASRVVSLSIALGSALALFIGSACGSIPDSRKILPEDFDGGESGGAGGRGSGGSGGSTETDGGETGGSGGKSNSGGSGGKSIGGAGGTGSGGASSGGGTSGAGGGLGSGGATGKSCGTLRCSDISLGTNTLPACCTGPSNRRCGVDFSEIATSGGCVEVNAPGQPNTNCPSRTNAEDTYTGCCRADTNSCGIRFTVGPVNFGCIDPQVQDFPAGGSCAPVQCALDGASCETKDECCSTGEQGAACVDFDGNGSRCAQYCLTNAECASGCCATLNSGFGACSPNPADCSAACRTLAESCDDDGDCCSGSVCASNGSRGPKTCHATCTTSASCAPEFCIPDGTTRKVCTFTGQGLCTNTCVFANDGECDDGGPGATFIDCALGTDCVDCAAVARTPARAEGVSLCSESCQYTDDGECDDGGPGSTSFQCGLGTDCIDCGRRLGICSDDCSGARNGICNDGGESASDATCATGTDCSDCGVRFGGRGQGICDATAGTLCNMNGAAWLPDSVNDGSCDCDDCAWDAMDCDTPNKCDGAAIDSCCNATDSCGWGEDGFCDCRGWCDWEPTDCGITSSGPAQ